MEAIFPMPIIEQEMATDRWIRIPDPVREALAICARRP